MNADAITNDNLAPIIRKCHMTNQFFYALTSEVQDEFHVTWIFIDIFPPCVNSYRTCLHTVTLLHRYNNDIHGQYTEKSYPILTHYRFILHVLFYFYTYAFHCIPCSYHQFSNSIQKYYHDIYYIYFVQLYLEYTTPIRSLVYYWYFLKIIFLMIRRLSCTIRAWKRAADYRKH